MILLVKGESPCGKELTNYVFNCNYRYNIIFVCMTSLYVALKIPQNNKFSYFLLLHHGHMFFAFLSFLLSTFQLLDSVSDKKRN